MVPSRQELILMNMGSVIPSLREGVAKLRAKTGPDLTIVDRKIQSGDFDELSD
jgi:hypothetical protein